MLKEELKKWPVQLGILFGLLALFLISNAVMQGSIVGPIIGMLIVIALVYFVAVEVKEGTDQHGWKHEVMDTVIALLVAVAIWYGASFVLNTSTPVSGVVSCSMLPNLQRGDFVIVQGAPVSAYTINMSKSELDSLNAKATIRIGDQSKEIDGSVFGYCSLNRNDAMCKDFIDSPESLTETKGAFTYKYQRCPVHFTGSADRSEPCLESITFHGKEYLTNFSNDIVVYSPPKGDLYASVGDIVHRVLFAIDADGKRYYLTRGDNNPVLDLQVYDYGTGLTNHPIPQESLRGKVISRIPYLGYFKLFISGYFQEDAQCKTQLVFDHV